MSGKYCLDSNIFIGNWGAIYPIDVFPSLWNQISKHQSSIILLKPICDEIRDGSLLHWLKENLFFPVSIDDETEKLSLCWEKEPKGVSQNDLTLIAYAKRNDEIVVTHEGDQADNRPKKNTNTKFLWRVKKKMLNTLILWN